MKPHRVFLCEHLHPTAAAKLSAAAEIVTDPTVADAAINRNLRMDREWMDRCPHLKVIGIHGTGTDGVDLEAARERGIRVVYAPGENADSVAELIAAFALLLSRQLYCFDRQIRAGLTPVSGGGSTVGRELGGKVFGTVGCGTVARKAAAMLKNGFGMEVVGCSRSLTPDRAAALGIRYAPDAAAVLEQADVISIGVPLTEQTRGMVNRELLSHAKPGAVFINTARGGVVDEDALYEALASGRLAAAACDVLTVEPPTLRNRLTELPNFFATPHIGANTEEALMRVSNSTVDQVLAVLDGRTDVPIRFVP